MDTFLQSSLKMQVSEEGRGAKHTHTHTHTHILLCTLVWLENGRKVFC